MNVFQLKENQRQNKYLMNFNINKISKILKEGV